MTMANNFSYCRIYGELRQRIDSGELAPGSRLETEMELRQRYGVSRETIRRALAMLESEGYIIRKVSAGTFVREKKTEYAAARYHESFTEQMERLGKKPSSEIRSIEILTECPSAVVAAMGLAPEEKVYRLKRVRRGDDIPMAYEVAYIRQRCCPNLHTRLLEDTSLYRVYEDDYHLHMDQIEMRIEATMADATVQKLLDLKNTSAVLKITSLMHLEDGTALYYVISYHAGDKYEYTTTMPRHL